MKSLSRSKITQRLVAGFCLLALLAFGAAAITDINLRLLDEHGVSLCNASVQSERSLAKASASFQHLVLANQTLRLDTAPESFVEAEKSLQGRLNAIETSVNEYAAAMEVSSPDAGVKMLTDACRKYAADSREYYRMGRNGNLFEAKKFYRSILSADQRAVSGGLQALTDAGAVAMEQRRAENTDLLASMRALMVIIFGAVIAAMFGLGGYFLFIIGRQLRQAEAEHEELVEMEHHAYGIDRAMEPARSAVRAVVQQPAIAFASASAPKPAPAFAPAVQNQPQKKMRLFFDDTVDYAGEPDSYTYR